MIKVYTNIVEDNKFVFKYFDSDDIDYILIGDDWYEVDNLCTKLQYFGNNDIRRIGSYYCTVVYH